MSRLRTAILCTLGAVTVTAAAAAWLTATENGQHFLISKALPYVPGLEVTDVNGSLKNLTLTGVKYTMPGVDVTADRAHLELALSALFDRKAVVRALELAGARVTVRTAELPPSEPDPQPSEPLTDLIAPLPVSLEKLALTDIHADIDGQRVDLESLTAGAHWTGRRITLTPSEIKGLTWTPPETPSAPPPAKMVQTTGQQLRALFAEPMLSALPAFVLPVDVTVESLKTENLAAPSAGVLVRTLEAAADITDSVVTLSTLNASLPEADASLSGKATLKGSWPVDLKGSATLHIDPLNNEKVTFAAEGAVLERLALKADAQGPVPAALTAAVELAQKELPLSLEVTSPELVWPPEGAKDAAGEAMRFKNVKATLTGKATAWQLAAGLTSSVKGTPEAGLKLTGHGGLTEAVIEAAEATTAGGHALVSGTLGWDDPITWRADANLDKLQIGAFAPGVDVVLNGTAKTRGRVTPKKWSVELPAVDLSAQFLKDRLATLKGGAVLESPLNIYAPKLEFRAGDNRITARGITENGTLDVTLSTDVPDPGYLVPGLKGKLTGALKVAGTPQAPRLLSDLLLENLVYDEYTLARATLSGEIQPDPKGLVAGDLALTAENGSLAGENLDKLTLSLSGTERAHTVGLSLKGDPVAADLKLKGALNTDTFDWTGTLSEGHIQTPESEWRQDREAALSFRSAASKVELAPHCWQDPGAKVCLADRLEAGQTGKASLKIEKLDLGKANPYLEFTRLKGNLTGTVNAVWDFANANLPTARWALEGHGVSVTQHTGKKDIPVAFEKLALTGTLDPKTLKANLATTVRPDGAGRAADAVIDVAVKDPVGAQALSGAIRIGDLDLASLNPFMPSGEKAEGILTADLKAGGALSNPSLFGTMAIAGVAVNGGIMPLTMKPSEVKLTFSGKESKLNGLILTDEGRLALTGGANWTDIESPDADVTAKGENLTITVPPYASVTVSPDVTVSVRNGAVTANGRIDVPKADIKVADLPPSAVSVSDDEVMMDAKFEPIETPATTIPMAINMLVHLGDKVRLEAFGLKARLAGDLKVMQDKRGLGLAGQLNIPDGRFHAYGQDLIVRRGRILFAGPVTQAALDIEAIRNPDAVEDRVTAGVRVTGSVERPQMKIFSNPDMSQQEQLSYLLTGQGVDKATGDESQALTSALLGLGLSQTGGLVKGIGDTFGIDDLGVSTEGVGDSSQVVVSGNITRDLQVKYGVGLFDSLATLTLRYRLLPKLYVEAVSGVNQIVDFVYKFEFD